MRYFTMLVALFLTFNFVACDDTRPPRPKQEDTPRTLDFSRLEEVQQRIKEKREREEQEQIQEKKRLEAEQQQKVAAAVKKYSLDQKLVPELVRLAEEAKKGSDIWTALDQTARHKLPDYLLSLSLEELEQMAEGDHAKESQYFGPFSNLNKEWLTAIKGKEGGPEFLLSLYLQISADWVNDPKCGELKQEALAGFTKKLTGSSIDDNVAVIEQLTSANQEVIGRMQWKRAELVDITAQAVMDQLNQLPEQEPKVLWHYLEALKKARLTHSSLYQEAKEILRRNNFDLEDEVRLSNL